jgi:glycosyltransferase involved in cell wall biosynthesis
LCPNGVDFAHFARHDATRNPPDDLAPILARRRPIIGYYGALAEWFDYDLVAYAAKALPDHEFVLIGPDYDGTMRSRDLFTLANVNWLGVKEYAELASYLRYFDVATIPFLVNEVTHSVSPIKLFEYMAGGRPIVTTDLRECARYSVVQVAKTPPDFVDEIRRAVRRGQDPAFRELLRNTARANTWDVRAGTLIDAAARHHRT